MAAARLVSAARPLASLRGNVSISSPTLSLTALSLFPLPSLVPCPSPKRGTLGWSGPQRDAPTALTLPDSHPAWMAERANHFPSLLLPADRPTVHPGLFRLYHRCARCLRAHSLPRPNPAEQSRTITVAAAAMPNAAVCHFASGRSFGRSAELVFLTHILLFLPSHPPEQTSFLHRPHAFSFRLGRCLFGRWLQPRREPSERPPSGLGPGSGCSRPPLVCGPSKEFPFPSFLPLFSDGREPETTTDTFLVTSRAPHRTALARTASRAPPRTQTWGGTR